MFHVFISYSTKNSEYANKLADKLREKGFDVWIDNAKLRSSENWWGAILEALRSCVAFIVVMTPESKQSKWVQREVALADDWGKPIFPLLLAGENWEFFILTQYENVCKAKDTSPQYEGRLPSPNFYKKLTEHTKQTIGENVSDIAAVLTPHSEPETTKRFLEAAMPACTQITEPVTRTEVRVKLSLGGSDRLEDELPDVIPSGDVIQKGDVRASAFHIEFPIDEQTEQLLPVPVCVKVKSEDFDVKAEGGDNLNSGECQVELELHPDHSSQTLIFALSQQSAPSRPIRSYVRIYVYREDMLIAETSVETRIVEKLEASPICNFWQLRISRYYSTLEDTKPSTISPLVPPISSSPSVELVIRGNKFLQRSLDQLRQFSVLDERVGFDQVAKETQARVFWKAMKGRIRRNGYLNLFFESGSTLIYVSDQFETLVLERGGQPEPWRIWTNNVLTFFQLLLSQDVDVKRFPVNAPDPEDRYGAIFPTEWRNLLQEPPHLNPRLLHLGETDAVQKMRKEIREFGEKTLLLATLSGWDLHHDLPYFQGPHVGSHPNMLFKRSLFTSGRPTVIFLAAEKLDDPFVVGHYYPIFGPDQPLDEALHEFPLAICIGYDQDMKSPTRRDLDSDSRRKRNDPGQILEALTGLGFNVHYYDRTSHQTGAIIVGNEAFQSLIPND